MSAVRPTTAAMDASAPTNTPNVDSVAFLQSLRTTPMTSISISISCSELLVSPPVIWCVGR